MIFFYQRTLNYQYGGIWTADLSGKEICEEPKSREYSYRGAGSPMDFYRVEPNLYGSSFPQRCAGRMGAGSRGSGRDYRDCRKVRRAEKTENPINPIAHNRKERGLSP